METYIDRIKLLKAQKKITNDQLASMTGIPLGTLSKLLAGMSDSPKLSNIIAICGALDCSVEYIVSGTPENTNNYTLNAEEIRLVEEYRKLDDWGRDLVETVVAKASGRLTETAAEAPAKPEKTARILPAIATGNRYAEEQRVRTGKRSIKMYRLPVSAGVGEYLEEDVVENISIPNNEKTAEADYALRISGNSMEPKYHNGDVLLVQNAESVEMGELGIFLLDGCGFFKVYGGDTLISLNPEYGPILLKEFANVQCKGRVVGKLKRK
jgi:phage repressor protein C with HTH and peptisase S24 domain/DNA-binding Xre family transcriptional regulator